MTTLGTDVREASAQASFLRTTPADSRMAVVLGAAAGCAAFFFGLETDILWRALAALQAAVAAGSGFVVLRSLVPLALSLSLADMMRLRTAFLLWTVCLVGLVAFGPVTRAVFALFGVVPASLALTLAALALTLRFLRHGSLPPLTLAFACAGLAFGASAFGAVATAVSLAILKAAATRLLGEVSSPEQAGPDPKLVDYFADPLVRSRTNWILALCFLACAALSCWAVRADVSSALAARLRIPWDYGVSVDGAAFLLATGVLPLVAAVGGARRAADTSAPFSVGLSLLFIGIAAASSVMLLNPALVVIAGDIALRVETGLIVLSCALYSYNALLSVTCLLLDVCCRDDEDAAEDRVRSLHWAARAVYALASLVPLALLALFPGIQLARR